MGKLRHRLKISAYIAAIIVSMLGWAWALVQSVEWAIGA